MNKMIAESDVAEWLKSKPVGWTVLTPEQTKDLKLYLKEDDEDESEEDQALDQLPSTMGLHCRLGRSALGWSMKDLAEASGMSVSTIKRLEDGDCMRDRTFTTIRSAMEAEGVVFIPAAGANGPGVRLARRPRQKDEARTARRSREP